MSDQFFWFVTRSSALLCWLSASLSMLVGLLTSSRLLGRRPTIPWLVDFHRLLAALAITFLGVHMLSLWLDSYVEFGPAELLIPWVATVPGLTRTSIALGVIAAWLLAAVQLSSLIKDRLPETVWRTIHLFSFGTLLAGTIHAIQAGSEADNPLVVGIGVSVLTAIALAAAVRDSRLRQSKPAPGTGRTPRSGRSDRETEAVGSSAVGSRSEGPGTRDAGLDGRPEVNGGARAGAPVNGRDGPAERSPAGRFQPTGSRTSRAGTRPKTPRRPR